MKTLVLILALSSIGVQVYSQPVTVEGALRPASNTDDYTMTDKAAENKLMERQFTRKSTGAVAMTYTRFNDTSFVFTEYDATGKELRKGMVMQNNAKAMHFKITKPDLEKDPEFKLGLQKDTILYDEFLTGTVHG